MSLLVKNAMLPSGKRSDILLNGCKIEKIAPSISARAEEKIDASSKIALPGFVNTHSHSAMALLRGVAEDKKLHDWLSTVLKYEAKMDAASVRAGSSLACLEMLQSGTTCFNDMYFHMDEVAGAVSDSGMRAVLGYGMVDMDDEKKRKSELAISEKFIRGWNGKSQGRITCAVAPHSLYICSRELLLASKEQSEKHALPLHIHLSETRKEVFDCLGKHKQRPANYFDSLGMLSSRTVAAHCVWLTKEEVRLLAKRGVSASLCPASNMKLAGGSVAPLPEMQEFKMNISLGTDGAASSNSLSMFESMKLCSLLVKNSRWDAAAAREDDILRAATLGGAKALGLPAGELSEGKLADIILVDAKAANLAPLRSIAASAVYSAHAGNVADSIINGKIAMRERVPTMLDLEKTVESAQKEAERLSDRVAQ
ncbi:MAG: amidohydrolase [Candidatus Micrarchaeota archaeon]|nr:amidohydrolase [Candidatus Micrarchaeota archaeon]